MDSCENCKALLPDLITIFCPNCGITLTDLESQLAKSGDMKKVNVSVQIISTFLPVLNLHAANRINRLRPFLVSASWTGILSLVLAIVVLNAIITIRDYQTKGYDFLFARYPIYFQLFLVIWWLTISLFNVRLMIKWSRQYNKLQSMLEKITVHGDTVIVNPELSRLGDVSKPQDQMQENKNLLSSGTAENTYYKNKKTDSHNGWLRAIAETLPLKRKRLMISVIAFGICIIILAMIQ